MLRKHPARSLFMVTVMIDLNNINSKGAHHSLFALPLSLPLPHSPPLPLFHSFSLSSTLPLFHSLSIFHSLYFSISIFLFLSLLHSLSSTLSLPPSTPSLFYYLSFSLSLSLFPSRSPLFLFNSIIVLVITNTPQRSPRYDQWQTVADSGCQTVQWEVRLTFQVTRKLRWAADQNVDKI